MPVSRLWRTPARGVSGARPLLLAACLAIATAGVAVGAAGGASTGTLPAITGGGDRAPAGVRLESIAARLEGDTIAILIQSSEPAAYVTTQPDPLTVFVDFRNVSGAGVTNQAAAAAPDAIDEVSVEDMNLDGTPVARVTVRLARATTPHVKSERNVVRIELDRAEQPAASAAGDRPPDSPVNPATASAPSKAPGESATNALRTLATGQTAPPQGAAGQQAPQPGALQQAVKTGEKQYTGFPISLDFAGSDIRAVLRSFVDISGLNIIIDPSVQGTVDIALRDVPWDQALDIILKSNNLSYVVDGTVVRIAPVKTLAAEESERRKLAEEQALGGDLTTLTRTLSYANAEDIKNVLLRAQAVTKRGQVEVDKRSNTVIVRDLPASMPTVTQIIQDLDKPQPQVEIEARIVQTTRTFARQLGVQWGFLGQVDAAHGNTTPLAFPNNGSVSGRTGAASPTGVPSMVNLETASKPTSAIGLAMGAVNGAFNLDVALSALEESGQGRILSTPRVLAQNNFEAKMIQGVQVPIQTVANNTVTVTFKDAALKLVVTPQITANGTVIMKISVENAAPDYTKSVNNIPPINTQQAETQVLIKDNETIVIGGIYVSNEQTQSGRTPGLYRLPLLGWLFKRDDIKDESNELLIFITPRIMKG